MKVTIVLLAALTAAAAGPVRQGKGDTRSKPAGADSIPRTQSPTLPTFTDVADEAGIRFHHRASWTSQKYMPEPMNSGVAFLDYDGDGWLDLYFVNGAALDDPMPKGKLPEKSDPRYWNRLYRNAGDGTFLDVTEKAGLKGEGYGMGVAVGYFDNDGTPDLYVTNLGRNSLYRNNGDGTFEDVTVQAGVTAGGWSTGAAFLDYDRDGRQDLVVARYAEWDFGNNPWCGPERLKIRGYCHPNTFRSVLHALFRNNGDGTFHDVSRESGLGVHPGKGLGIAVNDYNRDGWSDILVANDTVAQQLFHNNGDGTFREVGLEKTVAYNGKGQAFAGMGVDFEDFDNDGWPDVLLNALSLQGYVLFRNIRGDFEDTSEETGLTRLTMQHSGWGMKFFDYDNDGWKDIFVAQGHVMDTISIDFPNLSYKQNLLLLRNRSGRFEDVSGSAGPIFQRPLAARGAAFGDFNNDGFLDIAVNVNDGPALLLKNGGNRNHWIRIQTMGAGSNRDGIGSQIRITDESGAEQYGVVTTASSYLSASDRRVHFGLGASRRVKLIEIRWPAGAVQRIDNVEADRTLTLREPATASTSTPLDPSADR